MSRLRGRHCSQGVDAARASFDRDEGACISSPQAGLRDYGRCHKEQIIYNVVRRRDMWG